MTTKEPMFTLVSCTSEYSGQETSKSSLLESVQKKSKI
jgi:hypothetical protein